jgi:hypothetical protein
MTRYLVDTNVISASALSVIAPSVIAPSAELVAWIESVFRKGDTHKAIFLTGAEGSPEKPVGFWLFV